jgi:hypothetical protein
MVAIFDKIEIGYFEDIDWWSAAHCRAQIQGGDTQPTMAIALACGQECPIEIVVAPNATDYFVDRDRLDSTIDRAPKM